jgi:hypothetical protein
MRKMRQRRRESLNPVPGGGEMAAEDMLAPAVREALAALGLDGKDAAAAKLAELLAVTIDRADSQAWAMRWLAPELLRVLGELGATPLARAKLPKSGRAAPAAPTRIQELRGAHAAMKLRQVRK